MQPDLFFVSTGRQDIISDHLWGAPDLVVEFMSPHPRMCKVHDRIRYFAEYGVRECWLIHQLTREVEVLELSRHGASERHTYGGIERIESSVLPYFGLSPELLSCR